MSEEDTCDTCVLGSQEADLRVRRALHDPRVSDEELRKAFLIRREEHESEPFSSQQRFQHAGDLLQLGRLLRARGLAIPQRDPEQNKWAKVVLRGGTITNIGQLDEEDKRALQSLVHSGKIRKVTARWPYYDWGTIDKTWYVPAGFRDPQPIAGDELRMLVDFVASPYGPHPPDEPPADGPWLPWKGGGWHYVSEPDGKLRRVDDARSGEA